VVVVVHQVGVELVGLALEEAVEAVEAASQRPLVEGSGGRRLLHRAQVPLADREGGVALVAQHLGHGRGVVGDVAQHVGKPVSKFDRVRMPTAWWLRPVSSAARDGEHSGVTWKLVNARRRGQAVDVRVSRSDP
jgi:hypothetical protein